MREKNLLPEGFEIPTRKTLRFKTAKPPMVTFSKTGYLIFNASATAMLKGKSGQNKFVILGYNPKEKELAIVPLRTKENLKDDLKILKMTFTGKFKEVALVSFRKVGKMWNLPQTVTFTSNMIIKERNGENDLFLVPLNDNYSLLQSNKE